MTPKNSRGHGRDAASRDGAVRSVLATFRVSPAEWDYIKRLAEDYEMAVSELIRDCLLVDMPQKEDR